MPAATATGAGVRRHVEHAMGMPISLALRGRHADSEAGRAAWAAVMAELGEADRIFSTYRPDSVVNRLDRGELILEQCPDVVATVLQLGVRATEASSGAFSTSLPVDPRDPDGLRRLDPSGVVKGWAAERASRHLAVLEDTDYCLSAGGDVVCRAAAGRPAWRIGIEDPHNPSRVVAVVPLHSGAVATSGTAHRGNHLVDARTGRAPHGLASVTVIGPSLTWADIDATAAYALGEHAVEWLGTRPIHSALVISSDGVPVTVVPHPEGRRSRSGTAGSRTSP